MPRSPSPAVSTPVAKQRAGNGHNGPIGGRGCIRCGKHNTESFSTTGVAWCNDCGHRWVPCRPGCRGYDLEHHGPIPKIRGCKGCGTPDDVVQRWPEAWRAMAKKLDFAKRESSEWSSCAHSGTTPLSARTLVEL